MTEIAVLVRVLLYKALLLNLKEWSVLECIVIEIGWVKREASSSSLMSNKLLSHHADSTDNAVCHRVAGTPQRAALLVPASVSRNPDQFDFSTISLDDYSSDSFADPGFFSL
ncbi:hypothetical protein HG531_012784 [Fusarium graminearum]|nr:hypothetical protein HG531_012784 [Fusarium graminearum]